MGSHVKVVQYCIIFDVCKTLKGGNVLLSGRSFAFNEPFVAGWRCVLFFVVFVVVALPY